MSHSIQPVLSAQGSTRNVDGSGTMTKLPAPAISSRPMPPPAPNTEKTLRCEVSFASKVDVMAMPERIARAVSAATSVLPRSTPCWSQNAKRMSSSLRQLDLALDRHGGAALLGGPQFVAVDEGG